MEMCLLQYSAAVSVATQRRRASRDELCGLLLVTLVLYINSAQCLGAVAIFQGVWFH